MDEGIYKLGNSQWVIPIDTDHYDEDFVKIKQVDTDLIRQGIRHKWTGFYKVDGSINYLLTIY